MLEWKIAKHFCLKCPSACPVAQKPHLRFSFICVFYHNRQIIPHFYPWTSASVYPAAFPAGPVMKGVRRGVMGLPWPSLHKTSGVGFHTAYIGTVSERRLKWGETGEVFITDTCTLQRWVSCWPLFRGLFFASVHICLGKLLPLILSSMRFSSAPHGSYLGYSPSIVVSLW